MIALIGIAMIAVALLLIWFGLPDRDGIHPRVLRFSAAQSLYPPVILVFIALGSAAIISSIHF
jgi:hypothetical protein